MFDAIIKTPIGNLGLKCRLAKLISIQFLEPHVIPIPSAKTSEKIKEITHRINAFFSRPQSLTDIPHELHGSDFQRQVWQALRKIPVGETRTYGELAYMLDTSARAIGKACRTNPLPLIIPCHRVVAASNLGGYCGQTSGNLFSIKQWLLAHES